MRVRALSPPLGQDTVLSSMGQAAGGEWLKVLVSVDAFVVLSGSVLTSYVGVTGLIRRMAMDRCAELARSLTCAHTHVHTQAGDG